jgi:hypothetical protein
MSTATLSSAFAFVGPTRVTPNTGPIIGGQAVTITGYGFNVATGVTFDGLAAADFVIVSNTQITCTTPPHAVGLVDVNVLGVASNNDLYTYVVATVRLPPIPVRSSVGQGGDASAAFAKMQIDYQKWLMVAKQTLEQIPLTPIGISALTIPSGTVMGRNTAGYGGAEALTVLPDAIQDATTRTGTLTSGSIDSGFGPINVWPLSATVGLLVWSPAALGPSAQSFAEAASDGVVQAFAMNADGEAARLTPGGAPTPRSFAPGSFEVQTERFVIVANRLALGADETASVAAGAVVKVI